MNTEYTEEFDRERFKGGEIAGPMIGEMYGEVFNISFVSESVKDDSFKVKFGDGSFGYRSMLELTMYWRMKPKASDDVWIPVVNDRCPQALGFKACEWEYKACSGEIIKAFINIHNADDDWKGIVAVRLIKPQTIGIDYAKDFKPPETPKQRETRIAWERFTQSPRYKEMHPQPVAMIGEVEESRIAGEALAAFDRVWPRKA